MEISSVSNFFKYKVPKKSERVKSKVILAFMGVLIGAINGIFGAGGGMLAVPVLTHFASLDAKKAHATAIAVMLPLSVLSAVTYLLTGSFEEGVILPTVIGVVIGGIIGAAALKKASGDFLNFLFYGVMLLAGIRMVMA